MPKQTAAKQQPAATPDEYYDFVYVSRAAISGDISAELVRIQAQAKTLNQKHGVSGALIYQAGYFLQWLEGPKAAIEKLIPKLEKDTRHTDFRTLLFEPQHAPLTGGWSMGTATRDEDAQAMDARVQAIIDGAKTERWSANEIVRRFVKPGRVSNPRKDDKGAAVARISVLANNSTWPCALVRHIAQAEKLPSVQQTLFSRLDVPDDDSICEYIDLTPSPGAVLRISCFSGWMAQSPLFDLLSSDDQMLVLMFKSATTAATLEYTAGILSVQQRKANLVLGVFSPRAALQADAFLDYAKRAGFDAQVVLAPLAEPAEIWDAIRQASRGALKGIFPPPPPPAQPVSAKVIAVRTPAPHKQAPSNSSAQEQPVATISTLPSPALPLLDAKLYAALVALLSNESAVQEWAAWAYPDLSYLTGSQVLEAPAAELHALEALQAKLDPQAPIESLSAPSQDRFEWVALLPWQADSIWVRVVLRGDNVSFGMAQFLSSQWKAGFAQYQSELSQT